MYFMKIGRDDLIISTKFLKRSFNLEVGEMTIKSSKC